MAICDSIPADVADQISSRLDSVANMLRAMREISITAATPSAMAASGVAVGAICERAHLMLDACIKRMGDPGLGNFDDSAWGDGDAPGRERGVQ